MKHIKIFVIVMLLLLTGCSSTKTYIFEIETGDSIQISLKSNDRYSLSSTVPFKISKDDVIITRGFFITNDTYNNYLSLIKDDENAKLIKQGTKNGNDYIFYEYNNDNIEYNYVIKIKGSNTAVILSSHTSKEDAKEIFNKLKITKK